MNELIIHHIASGHAFFSGVVLIHLAMWLGWRRAGRATALGRTMAGCLGLILIAASATPLPGWLCAVAGSATLVWIVADRPTFPTPPRVKTGLRALVLACWWLGVGIELPYHRMPRVRAPQSTPVFVVGDSLSAGMGGESTTWPRLLAERSGLEVRSFARSGATVALAAREQAPRVVGPGALVLAEIGGNDLLGGTPPDAFAEGLDRLLGQLSREHRAVVLFELPLPPFFNRYGAIQRRLARKHGALLVPKRVLLGVLTTPGATLDTVHLSRRGHERMAQAVWKIVGSGRRRTGPGTSSFSAR